MNIRAIFTQMGVIIGDFTVLKDAFEIKNPCLLITHRETANLVPLLLLMEEDFMTFKKESAMTGEIFTPIIDIVNNYNQIYGSGIVQVAGTYKL